MATVQELERAFLNAHNAGDKQAAQALADALRQAMTSQPAPAPTPKERTTFEAVKDVGAGLVSGAGALAQLPGQLYGLATGEFSDTGLTKVGRQLRETGEGMKSEELKRLETERAAKIKEAGKEGELSAGITAFKETIANPALLSNFIAEQAPNLLPGLAVARGLSLAGAGARTAVAGAVGTGATQQGADIGAETFKELHKKLVDQGVSPEEATGRVLGYARTAGLEAGVISIAAQMLPGGRAIERAMAKTPIKGGRILGGIKGGAGEAISEAIEEGGGKVAQNLAVQKIDPTRSLTEGLGETMGMAAVGGLGLGTAAGVTGRREAPPVKEEEKTEEAVAERKAEPAEAPATKAPSLPTDAGLSYGTATQEVELLKRQPQTPETVARIGELQAYRLDVVQDDLRRRSAKPEDKEQAAQLAALRQQMESGAMTQEGFDQALDEILADFEKRTQKLSKPPTTEEEQELKDLVVEANKKSRELVSLQSEKGGENNLRTFLRGKLVPEDVVDMGTDKVFRQYAAKKGQRGVEISDMVADGFLDPWLPEGMRPDSSTFDEKDSTEYIKELVRQQNFRPYNAQVQAKLLGEDLQNIEARIAELRAPSKVSEEVAALAPEERQQEAAALAAEAGFQGAPEEVVNVPEEQEEYFPDQEEVRGRLAEEAKKSESQAPDWVPQNIWNLHERLQRADAEASGEVSLRPNKEGKVPRTQDLKRNQVMAFRRLNTAIEEYVGNDWQKVNDLMVRMNEESSRREKERPTEEREAFVINKDKEHERIEKELTGKDMLGVSRWAIDNAPNKFAKALAQKVFNRLNGMSRRGIKMEFKIASGDNRPFMMRNARGLVDFDFGKAGEGKQPVFRMTLNGAAVLDNQNGYPPGMRYITVLHELLHVATVGQISVLKSSDPIVKELNDLFNQVVRHFNAEVRAGRLTPFMEKVYGREINALDSPEELLAWGIADEDMQRFLSDIKVGDKTIMDKLVELIRKMLNVTKPYLTALDQLVKTTESILDEDVDVVGDKIVARQYSFGVAPGRGEVVQGTLFEQAKKPGPVQAAAAKAKAALQPRKFPKSQFDGVSDEYYDALKPIFAPDKKTIVDKIDSMRDSFWQRLAQGIADQYRTIKDYSEEAYMKARMSKTIDGALEGILFNGQVKLTNGALDIKPNTKGLMQALEPVGNEVDRYQIWVALQRDAKLVKQGKAPSVPKELVQRRNELSAGKIGDKSRLEVYEQVQKDMNQLNRSVLNIAREQGVIDQQAYDVYASDINYIPFYKVMDEGGDVQAAATKSGLVNQYFSKALKGGERPFGDLMENTLRNWSHILSSSMKNEAANATIRAAMDVGAAFPNLKVGLRWEDGKVYSDKSGEMIGDGKLKPEYTTSGKGKIQTMIDGKPAYFEVADPLLLESIMSIGYMGPKSKFLDIARDFKNLLQFGVTLSPAFKIRNLFRDSISAIAVSDLKRNPFANVIQGWAASDRNNPAHISALAGGAIFNFGSAYEGDQSKMIRRLLDQGIKGENILDNKSKITNALRTTWTAYQDLGNKSESANRMALYQQLRDTVNPKTGENFTHLEASFYARDLLDFSMQGAWPAFRLVTQVIPFLNARVQGLYKLGRDGIVPTSRVIYNTINDKEISATDKQKAQQFSIVMSAVALASLMLYMAFKDDEEFKKREQWDRDNFWWFKLPGMDAAVRVPKPFEIGAFGTMVERVAEQIIDQGAEGKVFEQSLKRMLTDTFAINPIPQVIKPLVDLYANKDSFTGAPIETAGMERLSKAERIAEKTSPLAIALSKVTNVFLPEATEVSPVQADYAIKGYLGWLGGTASWLSHYAVMPFSKSAYPDNNWTETMSAGFIKTLPAAQSRYVTSFYENNKEIAQAYADMRHFAQLGESDKVQKILEEKGDKIAMAKFYDNASKDMAKMRQVILHIRRDEDMSGAQKKEEIDRLKVVIGEIARQMEESRLEVKKQYAASR
jgi:hypothetical protein